MADTIRIRLSHSDHELLATTLDLPDAARHQITAGVLEGNQRRFDLSPDVVDALLETIEDTAAVTRRYKLQRSLARLHEKLMHQASRAVGLEINLDGSIEPAANELYNDDWSADTPGLQLRNDLPLQQLAGATVIHNARALLTALGRDGTRATAKGNLNRAFVREMVDTLRWPDGFVDDLFRYNKVINEGDVWPLEALRINLELSGLVRKYKGCFVITRRGNDLLKEDRAGALLALLFRTWFQKFNLAYTDRLPDYPDFQSRVVFSFWQLSRLESGWQRLVDAVPKLLPPGAVPSIPRLDHYDFRPWLAHARLLEPLENFGLVELEREATTPRPPVEAERFRRTPLFAAFLDFSRSD